MPIMNIQSSGVNLPSDPQRKPSTLENVALALGIAKDVIGTGLDVYKTVKQDKNSDVDRAKTLADIGQITEPSPGPRMDLKRDFLMPSEPVGEFNVPGLGPRVPSLSLSRLIQESSLADKKEEGTQLTDQDYTDTASALHISEGLLRRNYKTRGDLRSLIPKAVTTPEQAGSNAREVKVFDSNKFSEIRKRHEKIESEHKTEMKSINSAEALLAKGDSIDVNLAGTLIRRVLGKDVGNQSYQEVQMILPKSAPGLWQGILNKVTGSVSAPFSVEELKALRSTVGMAKMGLQYDYASAVHDLMEREQVADPELFQQVNVRNWRDLVQKQTPRWMDIENVRSLEAEVANLPSTDRMVQEANSYIQKMRVGGK
jgi:hypothetical protein